MKKSISYLELQKLDNFCTSYLHKEGYFTDTGWSTKAPTKFVSNMKNIIKQMAKAFDAYKERLDDLGIDHCLTDEKTKAILRDEKGGFRFDKDGLRAYKKAAKTLGEEKVDLHVRITQDVDGLSEEEIEVFAGILIPELETNGNAN